MIDNNLPYNWIKISLGDVAELYQPKTLSTKEIDNSGEYYVYGANGIIGKHSHYNHANSELLITCRGATCGNVHISRSYSWINGNAMVVKPFSKSLLLMNYLYYVFSTNGITKEAISGSAQPQITRVSLSPIKISLPPIAEQHRIVAKIEELFSELDKGIETLKTAQQQLKVYRQAVLKYAFEGKLTNPDVKEGELPEGWDNVKINLISKIETGTTPSKSNPKFYEGGDVPFYKPTDLEKGINVNVAREYVSSLGVEKARFVPEGSTLVTCIGATIGKTGFLTIGGVFNQQINAMIPNQCMVPKFLYYQAISPLFQNQIVTNASATTLPILNKGKFSELFMNICDKKLQHVIVQEIESRLSVCDKLQESIEQGLQQAEALRQSILKKAFEGKLVPQDPNDEPAGVLLDRIKAARAVAQPEKKTRTKKTKV